jgi:hypothetical protein
VELARATEFFDGDTGCGASAQGPGLSILSFASLLTVDRLLCLEGAYQRLHELLRGGLKLGLLILLRPPQVEIGRLSFGQ